MSNDVARIKEKLNLIDFVKSYITLIPAGRNFKALCPFHGERTPSFVVSPERQMWYCFGACGEGGDIIKFVMKYENLDFAEALRYLAERAGVTLLREMRNRTEMDVLYDLHEAAKSFYVKQLLQNKEARDYLSQRGVLEETASEFDIGFAPYGDNLTTHLIKQGFGVSDILRSGLALKTQSGLMRDKFQERVTFPIMSSTSRTIAFTGRLLPRVQAARESNPQAAELPKYLNSAESPIFNKSKVLYAYNKTKAEIVKRRAVFLVEGQMDAVMSYQAGVRNVVASSGTGFTEEHARILRRLAETVIVSFDSDQAGLEALNRTLPIFLKNEFHVLAVDLSGYKDPADMVFADSKSFVNAVSNARPVFEYIIEKELELVSKMTLMEKRASVNKLLNKLVLVSSAVEREEYLNIIARRSGVSPQLLQAELAHIVSKGGSSNQVFRASGASSSSNRFSEVKDSVKLRSLRLVEIAFVNDEFLKKARAMKDEIDPALKDILERDNDDEQVQAMRVKSETFLSADLESLRREFEELVVRIRIDRVAREMLDLQREMGFSDVARQRFQDASKRKRELEALLSSGSF